MNANKNKKKHLVIVESPAKAKTINKYLGSNFDVIASFGHVRDLPKKTGSIDIDNNFTPAFQLIDRNKKNIDEIIKKAKNADIIYLATDPDREGEAIAWHIQEIFKQHVTQVATVKRITFHEITASAIKDAIKDAHELNVNLIEAQISRLTLDYLIGFNISPLLWRKIKSGLSAGRVQSPALRLICERENEIKNFVQEIYFSITANLEYNIKAKLVEIDGKKLEERGLKNEEEVKSLVDKLSLEQHVVLHKINKRQRKKSPPLPFITSSLQMEAVRKLGFSAEHAMRVAQDLYEGIDIGKETVGLITYMRTDSINLSKTAIDEIRTVIKDIFPPEYLPDKPRVYKKKIKNAQEAHEAIRPTSILRSPNEIGKYLTADQYKLYNLIWMRTLSSQLSDAIFDVVTLDFKIKNKNIHALFRASGSMVYFDGFLKIYNLNTKEQDANNLDNTDNTNSNQDVGQAVPQDQDPNDQDSANEENTSDAGAKLDMNINAQLADFTVGMNLMIEKIEYNRHQTEPKPRFNEASLIKMLEDLGIGRPSTYTSIISTLKKREYVKYDSKRFTPTDVGMVVNNFLTEHLNQYVDFDFTANMENALDTIADGKQKRVDILNAFWQNLHQVLQEKQKINRADIVIDKDFVGGTCPQCSSILKLRLGKYGKFIGCSGYPACKYYITLNHKDENKTSMDTNTQNNVNSDRSMASENLDNQTQAQNNNQSNMAQNQTSNEEIVKCPNCENGLLIKRKNRYNKFFYGCNQYPRCKTAFNQLPK